jgi:predicted flap endonuclease-1-like 5' DNA nuclease
MDHPFSFLAGELLPGAMFATLAHPGQETRERAGPLGLLYGLLSAAGAALAALILAALLLWWWLNRPPSHKETRGASVSTPLGKIRFPVPAQPEKSTSPDIADPSVEAPATDLITREPPVLPIETVDRETTTDQPAPDDLKRIRGIGPKTADLLQSVGIQTYAQLAMTNVDSLREILTEAGISSVVNPTTWPKQARLAAEDDWNALKALQEELRTQSRAG